MTEDIQAQIKRQLTEHPIILYMKGTPQFPQCGFSSKAVMMLQACQAQFAHVNILEEPDIRQGIKTYSNWPTIPQLYVKGEFIGGCDIMAEMMETGELMTLIGDCQPKSS